MFVAAFQGAPYAGFLPLCAAIGILTSAVTLALFIKFFGASFLSRTSALVRSRAAKRETLEVGWMMQAPQVLLASACIVLGVVPAIAIHFVGKVLDTSRQGFGIALANGGPLQSRLSTGVSEVNATALFAPIMVAVVMLLTFGLAVIMSRIGHAQRRTAAAWLCGYAQEAECHRYIASSFYHEIKRHVFGGGVRPARRLS
jgi:NADH:ubiquinone oxidoreductase subunit 5 (subunit L)/multisubunit Na+/H+ antiporter MnhA subunit